MNQFQIACYVLAFAFFCSAGLYADTDLFEQVDRPAVRIGVLTQQGVEKCEAKWGPTAQYLTDHIPDLSFKIVPLFGEQVGPAVAAGEVDFILVTPSLYVNLESRYQVSRIATLKNRYQSGSYTVLGGVLFCRTDRQDIQTISDLKDKSLIGLHEKACTAWHAVCLALKENGIEPSRDISRIKFDMTSKSVVAAVRNKNVDAGALRSDIYERMLLSGLIQKGEFRVLQGAIRHSPDIPFTHSTRVFPEKPFAKVQYTSDTLAEQVATVLISMPADSESAILSQGAGWTIPHNYQSVHDCLKSLHLSPYENYGKVTLASFYTQYRLWIIAVLFMVPSIVFTVSVIIVLKFKLKRAQQVILEQQIIEASDNAYRRFSQDLHDCLGQQLTGIKFMVEILKGKLAPQSAEHSTYAEKISNLVHVAIQQTSDLAKGLNPVELSEKHFFSSVAALLRNIENTFNVGCKLEYDHSIRLGEGPASFHLYRIIQEAVHNAIKHGKAKSILIVFRNCENRCLLTIENDGRALSLRNNGSGLGLCIMKYRASIMNAEITLENVPTGGVRVSCSIPTGHQQHLWSV